MILNKVMKLHVLYHIASSNNSSFIKLEMENTYSPLWVFCQGFNDVSHSKPLIHIFQIQYIFDFLYFGFLNTFVPLYQYTSKEFPSLYYKKVKLPKKSTTVKAFWYCDWQLWIGLFHTGFSVISLYVHLMRKHI